MIDCDYCGTDEADEMITDGGWACTGCLQHLEGAGDEDMGAWYVLCDCGGYADYQDWESAYKVAYECVTFHKMMQKGFLYA